VQVWWRAPDDLAHLSSETDRYTVISRPPNPTAGDLALAPPTLPPELGERYLALPDDLPRRVGDLTREVVAGAETRYDQARAIESFLRTYTYTLELLPFPANRDLVDYFLFELQEGYCDYFASAMVVMARTAGIPARLATGYAQGTFDHESGRWVVSEADGHSWVEIYFAGAGWVEFEPTAGRAAPVRPGARSSGLSVPPVPPRTPSRAQMPWAVLVWAGALTLLVVTVLFRWQRWRGEAALGADLVRDRYQRMVHWGERLGQPLRDGQTAFEYGAILGENLAARGLGSRWARVRQASNEAPAEVEHLAETYVRAQYGQNPISEKESRQVRELWARLHRLLKWLWIARR
jgi:transglutaminase-like putative cysteine protease